MFTIEQIKEAHSKVKSGADFPAYIRDLKVLGATFYETYVLDGHTDYYGLNAYKVSSPAKYDVLSIAGECKPEAFKSGLLEHQQGKTDYLTFIRHSAETGVEKWTVDLDKMTCTYYDKTGNEILTEQIPQ
jgi:uncharacterized protein YbcV (DUF1398 family)